MACYNSLLDPHLSAFFASTRVRRHLRKAGLVSSLSSVGFVYATCTFMIIRVITSTWLSIWVDIKSLLGARHSVATHTQVGRGWQSENSQRTFKAIQGPGHTVGGAFLRNPGHWNFTQAWHNDLIQTKVHTKPCWGHTFHLDKGPSQFSLRQQAHQTV